MQRFLPICSIAYQLMGRGQVLLVQLKSAMRQKLILFSGNQHTPNRPLFNSLITNNE